MKSVRISLLLLLLCLVLVACRKSSSATATPFTPPTNGQLVFCGREDDSNRFDIYLLDLATRELLNLTKPYIFQIDDGFGHSIGCDDDMRPYRVTGAVWSPRGDLLVVDAGGPYLHTPYVISISDQGDVIQIVQQWPRPWLDTFDSPQQFSWSSKGDKIAFSAMTASDGYRNLFVGDVSDWMNSNPDTAVVQLTEEYRDWPGVIYYPNWSPDGQNIAVSLNGSASGIGILSADGSQSVYVTNDTSKQLSYVQSPGSPWIETVPSWFPDGKSVVFLAATAPNDRTALFSVDKDGQNLKLLIPKGVTYPVVSPDGQYIAYVEKVAKYELGLIGRIVRVDANGKDRQVLAEIKMEDKSGFGEEYYIRDLSWSFDGKWLVFTSNKSGSFQLYFVSTDGGTIGQVIDFPGDAVYPRWRPSNKP